MLILRLITLGSISTNSALATRSGVGKNTAGNMSAEDGTQTLFSTIREASYLRVRSGERTARSWQRCTSSSVPPEHRYKWCQTAPGPPGYRTDRAELLLQTCSTQMTQYRSQSDGTHAVTHPRPRADGATLHNFGAVYTFVDISGTLVLQRSRSRHKKLNWHFRSKPAKVSK